jgi:HEAT repeat protein
MTGRLSPIAVAAAVSVATVTAAAQTQWQDVVRNLRHPNPATRLDAVQRLGAAGYVQAIDPIAPLIADADDQVQGAALDAELSFFVTEKLGGGNRFLGVGTAKSRAQQAFEAGPLIRTATPAPALLVDNLIAAIRDQNPRVSFDAVHALGVIAEPPLTPRQAAALADNLDHYDPIIRAATARVIGRLQVHEAADQLRGALEDSNGTVRFFAIESLGKLRERRALPGLLDIVQRGKQPVYVQQALLALGRIAAPDDLAMFRQRIVDKDPVVRRASLEALGRLKDQDSRAAIEQAFNTDKALEVRLAAAFALQMLGTVQAHVIAANLVVEAVSVQAREYLAELGRDAVPGIESALKVATDSEHRAALAQLVGYLGTKDDLPVVEPLLKDRDQRVVRAATNAILRLRR